MTKKKSICIIPARGGSKRIKRKNIQNFCGHPIIYWAIELAQSSQLFDVIHVSTDDPEIAELANHYGADIPFYRSKKASDDHATTSEVLVEALGSYAARGAKFDYGCCIYPTSVLAEKLELIEGKAIIESLLFEAIFPVGEFPNKIWRSFSRCEDGTSSLNFPEFRDFRSQDLPVSYFDAGQWYWFDVNRFLIKKNLLSLKCGTIVIPSERVQDIDTWEDWEVAEQKFEKLRAKYN